MRFVLPLVDGRQELEPGGIDGALNNDLFGLSGSGGVPGGGMNALRGHSNIQGITEIGLMSNLLPGYLRFVRGVVDSANLPLNVSREILQSSKDVDAIRAGSPKTVLSLLEELAEGQQDKSATFWSNFGQVFKEGVGEDHANRERIAKLEEKGDSLLVRLETGFAAGTRDAELKKVLRAYEKLNATVDLATRASRDPAKYAPTVEEVTLVKR